MTRNEGHIRVIKKKPKKKRRGMGEWGMYKKCKTVKWSGAGGEKRAKSPPQPHKIPEAHCRPEHPD